MHGMCLQSILHLLISPLLSPNCPPKDEKDLGSVFLISSQLILLLWVPAGCKSQPQNLIIMLDQWCRNWGVSGREIWRVIMEETFLMEAWLEVSWVSPVLSTVCFWRFEREEFWELKPTSLKVAKVGHPWVKLRGQPSPAWLSPDVFRLCEFGAGVGSGGTKVFAFWGHRFWGISAPERGLEFQLPCCILQKFIRFF